MVNRAATSRWTTKRAVSGAESATFTPGMSERRGSDSRFYHGDIKNFVEQTDSSGQIVSSRQYDAFGNLVSSSGTWSGPFAYGGRFGYQSDGDTTLHLLGHRYYDSTTGRFLSRDPIKDGRNWYVYCDGNPVAGADPTGTQLVGLHAVLKSPDPPAPGERAAARAAQLVGQGPNDCKMWLNRCYEGIWPMPPNEPGNWTLANDYDDWFDRSIWWVEVAEPDPSLSRLLTMHNILVATTGAFPVPLFAEPQLPPGTVAVIDRSAQGRNGHVMIKGEGGHWYDASIPSRGQPSGRPGTLHKDRPRTNPIPYHWGQTMMVSGRCFYLAAFCAFSSVVGCGSPDSNRETRAVRLEPAAATMETSDIIAAFGDVSGVVVNRGFLRGTREVTVINSDGAKVVYDGAVASKWVEGWNALALADQLGVTKLHVKSGEVSSCLQFTRRLSDPCDSSEIDISADGSVVAIWAHGTIDIYNSRSGRVLKTIDDAWIAERTEAGGLGGSFIWGIALQPSARFLAVAVDSSEIEQPSGHAYPATAIVDLRTDDVRILCSGAPVVWLDDNTLVVLDVTPDWQTVPNSEAVVIRRSGETVGRLTHVMAAGAGPDRTVLLLRKASAGGVFVEVRSRDLRQLLERFDSGLTDWRDALPHFRITFVPEAR